MTDQIEARVLQQIQKYLDKKKIAGPQRRETRRVLFFELTRKLNYTIPLVLFTKIENAESGGLIVGFSRKKANYWEVQDKRKRRPPTAIELKKNAIIQPYFLDGVNMVEKGLLLAGAPKPRGFRLSKSKAKRALKPSHQGVEQINVYIRRKLIKRFLPRTINLNGTFPLRDDIASYLHQVYLDQWGDAVKAIRQWFQTENDVFMLLSWCVKVTFDVVNSYHKQLSRAIIQIIRDDTAKQLVVNQALKYIDWDMSVAYDRDALTAIVLNFVGQYYPSKVVHELGDYISMLVLILWAFIVDDFFELVFQRDDPRAQTNDNVRDSGNVGDVVTCVIWPSVTPRVGPDKSNKYPRMVRTTGERKLFWEILPQIDTSALKFQLLTEPVRAQIKIVLDEFFHNYSIGQVSSSPEIRFWVNIVQKHLHDPSEVQLLSVLSESELETFIDLFLNST